MIEATILTVRAYLEAGGTKAALAERAGVHRNTLAEVERDDWSPTLTVARKIDAAVRELVQSNAA